MLQPQSSLSNLAFITDIAMTQQPAFMGQRRTGTTRPTIREVRPPEGASALSGGVVPITIGTDGGKLLPPPVGTLWTSLLTMFLRRLYSRPPRPSAGVYGFKPSHSHTCVTNQSVVTIGPMASTVSDLVIAYRVMSQPDPVDGVQGSFDLSRPPQAGAKKYIGIWRECGWISREPGVLKIYNQAIEYPPTSKAG